MISGDQMGLYVMHTLGSSGNPRIPIISSVPTASSLQSLARVSRLAVVVSSDDGLLQAQRPETVTMWRGALLARADDTAIGRAVVSVATASPGSTFLADEADTIRGEAVFVGPTLYAKLSDHFTISAAYSAQVSGHAVGVPRQLDLDNFSRHQARLVVNYEF